METMLTVIETCRQQGRNVFAFVTDAVQAPPRQATHPRHSWTGCERLRSGSCSVWHRSGRWECGPAPDKAIVWDKVFGENRGIEQAILRQDLRRLLRVEKLIVIPTEPGMSSGMPTVGCGSSSGSMVLVNDYRNVDSGYRSSLMRVLKGAGLDVIELPYRPRSVSWGIPTAFGCYINYLQVGRLVVLPSFRLPEDEKVVNLVHQSFPDTEAHFLNCSDLSAEGGS